MRLFDAPLTSLAIVCATLTAAATTAATPADRIAAVTGTPGFVAFWDFVQREPAAPHRFTAHVPAGATNRFPLDAGNYIHNYWGEGREATYADFPLLGRGPFGEAIRIRQETDATFRPFLFVPRARLHDSPIDLKGPNHSVTVVVWVGVVVYAVPIRVQGPSFIEGEGILRIRNSIAVVI
jgi:hypothetical protein